MKVLIVGSGGREHALAWKLAQSSRVSKIYIAPGNGGTHEVGENVELDVTQNELVVDFARRANIDLAVVQQDNLLANGLVDALTSSGIRTFGPTKAASRIEWSKGYAKEFMKVRGVPTARTFTSLEDAPFPIVIKADGLKQGKGVVIARTRAEAEAALVELGPTVVIEEFLEGTEVSVHAWCDGANAILFPVSRDHKRVGNGNTGPNTGGMGTIAPVEVPPELLNDILKRVVEPVVKETGFTGVLFPGLMLTKDGYRVLEYNARFGDPETESYMRLLKTDLIDILEACIDGRLRDIDISWSQKAAVTVMLASHGYPGTYTKGVPITIPALPQNVAVFHAGTVIKDRALETNGGRVLGVSAVGTTLAEARVLAYAAAEAIHFEGKHYRTDIGA